MFNYIIKPAFILELFQDGVNIGGLWKHWAVGLSILQEEFLKSLIVCAKVSNKRLVLKIIRVKCILIVIRKVKDR